jgi:hypothetical protein
MIEAAREAAAAGEFAAAERLLRDAAEVQEATLGASHTDLATTLNNLAFVCERTNRIDEAERGYRRAYAIALASLPPGDPMTAISLKNLTDFCAAHQIPVAKPPATGLEERGSLPEAGPIQRTAPARTARRTIGLSALGVLGVVALMLAMRWHGASSQNVSPARTVATAPVDVKPVPAPASDRPLETTSAPAEIAKPETTAAPAPAPVTVLNAQVCAVLDKTGSPDWRCTAAQGDVPPGTYTFYTRLLTDANTTVEHRWYHDERLHQVVRLRVAPSPGSGYRTFSSTIISRESAGQWRVELRSVDGALLHEARFVVR